MKKILLMRGAPGCGKSSLVDSLGLTPWALSMDLLRQVRSAPIMLTNGGMGLNQEFNAQVFQDLKNQVRERMGRGEFIVLDNTMPAQTDLNEWMGMAQEHGYDVMVADFSPMPLEQILAQNSQRHPARQVPLSAIERMHGQLQNPLNPRGARVVQWAKDKDMRGPIQSWMDVPLVDLSHFDAVVHIGDLQGCLTVLAGPGGPLERGFDSSKAYVFVGDLVDRGIENGAVVRWFHEHAVGRDNVFLIWGNHEDHLDRWARGLRSVSREFEYRTLPQLLEAGATPEMARDICQMAVDVLPYHWRGTKVMACHAGLSTVPRHFALVSSHQWARGTGSWQDPVDEQFERHAPKDWFQVHGHRNHGAVPVRATQRSFNLEDAVEFGGHLRTATLDSHGWSTGEYRNNVFLEVRNRSGRRRGKNASPIPLASQAPAWMQRPSETRMSDETLAAMSDHPGVRLRSSKRTPHINSLNFTKQVFFQASWDDVLVKARGLFIHSQTQEIVARGYEKFFNVGERPETKLQALRDTLHWPVTAYVKENGYLGNLGYDSETGELFIASKSTPDGDFADWFREIFENTVPAGQRERIRRWLRDNEASMVFEVNDPIRDPHMIDYDEPHLVLLDIFHRSEKHEKLPYDHMKAVGESFGLTAKRWGMQFKNAQALEGWYANACSDLRWRYRGEDIEGLVLEDQSGFQTKVKLPHYAFWKRMRAAKQRMAKVLERLDEMPEDGLRQKKETILARMQPLKETVKSRHKEGEDAGAARQELARLGQELSVISASLRKEDRRERLEEEMDAIVARDPHPLAQAFLGWARAIPHQELAKSSILDLRARWKNETNPDPSLWEVRWEAFADGNEEVEQTPLRSKNPRPKP